MNIQEFLFTEVLLEEIKLNNLSAELGKIIIDIINSTKKSGDDTKTLISTLKRIRKELQVIETKYYSKKISREQMTKHINLYINTIKKVSAEIEKLELKRKKTILINLNNFNNRLKKIKQMLK